MVRQKGTVEGSLSNMATNKVDGSKTLMVTIHAGTCCFDRMSDSGQPGSTEKDEIVNRIVEAANMNVDAPQSRWRYQKIGKSRRRYMLERLDIGRD